MSVSKIAKAVRRPSGHAYFNLERLNEASPKYDLENVFKPDIDPLSGRPRKGFETIFDAERERKKRSRLLRSFSSGLPANEPAGLRELAGRVGREIDGNCQSAANPAFARRFRRRMVGAVLELIDQHTVGDIQTYSIVPPGWRCTGVELLHCNPRTLREQLRGNLNRAGLGVLSGWLIAGFHCDYDPATGLFSPHFHIIVSGDKRIAVEGLRKLDAYSGGSGSTVFRPIVRREFRDPPRQASYPFQSYWPEKASIDPAAKGARRRRRRSRRRILGCAGVQALVAMHLHSFSDTVWLHGCRIHGGRLVLVKNRST